MYACCMGLPTLVQVLASREDEIAKLKELQQYEESGAASGAGAMRDPVACLGLTMKVRKHKT